MNVSELVRLFLLQMKQQEITQRKLAELLHISPGYLNHLLSRKNDVQQITLGTFDRMFPNATVDLGVLPGGAVSTTRSNVINNNFGTAEQTYNEAPRDPDGELLRRAADLATDLATEAGQVPLVPLLKGLRGLRDRK